MKQNVESVYGQGRTLSVAADKAHAALAVKVKELAVTHIVSISTSTVYVPETAMFYFTITVVLES